MKVVQDDNNNTPKRPRKVSESRLSSRDELFRETIRIEIETHPIYNWTDETLRKEAGEIAKSLSKNFDQVRKALMNRKNFIERKIMDSMITLGITDPYSPSLLQISEKLQMSHSNVFWVVSHNLAKITKKISEKNTQNLTSCTINPISQ